MTCTQRPQKKTPKQVRPVLLVYSEKENVNSAEGDLDGTNQISEKLNPEFAGDNDIIVKGINIY